MNVGLKWFKEQIKSVTKSIIENRVDKAIQELEKEEGFPLKGESPFLSVKLVNDNLTVVFRDGKILSKENATIEDYENAISASSVKELENLCIAKEVLVKKEKIQQQKEKVEQLIQGIELLEKLDDFIVEGNTVYLKGINRSLPQLLVEKFIEIVDDYATYYDGIFEEEKQGFEIDELALYEDEEYVSLKRFFMWCCLNPRAEVADSLYDFLEKNGMKITKQGFFVALRNVVKVEGADTELVHFITNTYNKVKAVWKKKPVDYGVFKDDEEILHFGEIKKANCSPNYIGNLQELYLNLPEMKENRYTDDWTKTFDIRIGKKVSMSKEECNWSTQDCAASGLHFCAHTADYVLCGDTTVFVLINPMKVVGIGNVKGRCYEYLPFMTTSVAEADEIFQDEDFDFLQLDEQYAIDELENLEEKVKEGFTEEKKKYEINISILAVNELKNIVKSLSEIKDEINGRIINVN